MRLLVSLTFCILSCLTTRPCFSQAVPTPLTLDAAVTLAVRQNPRLTAASRDIGAAQSGVRAARSLTNPSLTYAPGIGSTGGSDTELLVQQPLEINGTRAARTGVANAQRQVTEAGAIVELRNVVFQTKSAYYELVRAREQAAVTQDLLLSAQEFDRITRLQVEVGTRPGIDQTQTGIEMVRAQQQVTLAGGQVAAAQVGLNTQMGQQPDTPIGALAPLTTSPETNQAGTTPKDTTLNQALASRAEIQVEEANREVFRQQARQARASGLPDLVPQYRANSISGRSSSTSGFGLGISLPLLDFGGRRAQIRQSEQAARAQEARIAATQSVVRQEVTQALARRAAADTVVRGYQQGVLDQARQLLEASRRGFQEGKTSIVALLEAQRTYRSVQTEYINAQVDAAIARAEVERATGTVPASLLAQVAP